MADMRKRGLQRLRQSAANVAVCSLADRLRLDLTWQQALPSCADSP